MDLIQIYPQIELIECSYRKREKIGRWVFSTGYKMSKWLPENYRRGFNKNETLII